TVVCVYELPAPPGSSKEAYLSDVTWQPSRPASLAGSHRELGRCEMALRIVRSKFPPKQIPPVGRAKTAKKEKLLPVYVAEQNRLATRYLIEILAENRGLQAL